MAFHKYGMFAVFAVYAWSISQLPFKSGKDWKQGVTYRDTEDEAQRLPHNDPESPFFHNQLPVTKGAYALGDWLTDSMTVSLLLLFVMSNLGMYVMVCLNYIGFGSAVLTVVQ